MYHSPLQVRGRYLSIIRGARGSGGARGCGGARGGGVIALVHKKLLSNQRHLPLTIKFSFMDPFHERDSILLKTVTGLYKIRPKQYVLVNKFYIF